jgi:phosphomannomutase
MRNKVTAYITASHLPAEWNGIKFFHQDGVGFFEDENRKLGEISSLGNFKRGKGLSKTLKGMDEEYADFVVERIKPEKIRVVVDFGNGAACLLVPKILKKLGVKSTFSFDWPNPKFSNRDPEPKPESLIELCKKVVKEKADLGIAFDGDGDRAVFVDNTGKVIMTEQSAILFIRDIMKTQKGPVVVNIECSDIIEDEIKNYGQDVFRIPVGHTFLVKETKKHNAVFGVEKSGHICVPKFFWFDDAIKNSIYMIKIVSKISRPLLKVVNELPTRFFKRFEIECPDETKFQVIDNIKENAVKKYENVNTIDGVKIVFPDSWALIRASNTSPILRLSVEAKD